MANIYFIRHGQASFGAPNYDVLSPIGRQQAHQLGVYLGEQGVHFDRVYSGTLQRQRDTAQLALQAMRGKVGYVEDAGFNEIDITSSLTELLPVLAARSPEAADVFSGKTQPDPQGFARAFDELVGVWIDAKHLSPQESWHGQRERLQTRFEQLLSDADEEENIAVFTSAGVVSIIDQCFVVPSSRFSLNWNIANTSMSQLQRDSQQWGFFNQTPHLNQQPELRTLI